MNSKKHIQIASKANKMGIKSFVGQKQSKNVKFMQQDLKISKLTVSEVLAIQEKAKEAKDDESKNLDILKDVIRAAADGGTELLDEDFDNLPLDELTKLSNEIMKFSGFGESGK